MATASMAMSMAQGYGKYKEESRQADLDNRIKQVNNKRVQESMLSSYQSLETSKEQIEEAYIADSIDRQRAEAMSSGASKALSGASGVGGTGEAMRQQDIDVNSNINASRSSLNRERQIDGLRAQGRGVVSQANSQFNRMPDKKVSATAQLLESGMAGFRNVTAYTGFEKAWDANYGEDDPKTGGFNTENLIADNTNPFDAFA